MIEIRKKEGESLSAMLFRFTKRIQQSGLMKEARKRRFYSEPQTRREKRASASHREIKRVEIQNKKNEGKI